MNTTPSFNEYYQIVKESMICIDDKHIIKSGPYSELDYSENKESYVIYFIGKDYNRYNVIYYKNNQDNKIESYKRINSRLCQEDYDYLHNYTIIENALSGSAGSSYSVIITEPYGKKLIESVNDFIKRPIDLEFIVNDLKVLLQWLMNKPFYLGGVSPNNILIYKDFHYFSRSYNHLDIQNYYNLQFFDNNEESKDDLKNKKNNDYFDILKIIFWLKALSINPEIIEIPYDELLDSPTTSSHKVVQDLFNDPIIQKVSSLLLLINNNENVDSLLKFYFFPQKFEHSSPSLIPYRLKSQKYSLYDTEYSKEIRLYQFNDMHFIDPTLKETSSIIACLVGNLKDKNRFVGSHLYALLEHNKKPAQLYTIISNVENARKGMFTFYKKITIISPKCIVAESMSGSYGVIDDMGNTLVDFYFKDIDSIPLKESNGLLCKDLNGNHYIYDAIGTLIFSLGKGDCQLCNEFLIYGQETNILDLKSLMTSHIQVDEEYEIIHSTGSILNVKFKDGYRYFDTKRQDFINEHYYETEEEMKEGFALCHRCNQKNVIVYEDGNEIPIEFDKMLTRYGNQIFMYVESSSKSSGSDTCSFTVFKLENKFSSFTITIDGKTIYNNKYILDKCLSYNIEDESRLTIHYVGMEWHTYAKTEVVFDWIVGEYDLYGQPLEKKKKEKSITKEKKITENTLLIRIHEHNIKRKYINKKHIESIGCLEDCVVCNINGLAEVHGTVDLQEFGMWNDFIGYADDKMCYWEF